MPWLQEGGQNRLVGSASDGPGPEELHRVCMYVCVRVLTLTPVLGLYKKLDEAMLFSFLKWAIALCIFNYLFY